MASMNPFDLLVDDDTDDPSVFIAAHQQKAAAASAAVTATKKGHGSAPAAANNASISAKLPSKPLPPSQAVREARNEGARGGPGGRGYGRPRGPAGANRDFGSNDGILSNGNGFAGGFNESSERRGYGGGSRGGPRGGRRGGFNNGEADEGERPRRVYERHSGTGRRGDVKRDGAGRGNWGTTNDEITPEVEEPVAENEAIAVEKSATEEENVDVEKENPEKEPEEKEPEDKQMTLEEYEKVLEEKRKALLSLKGEERKVGLDKDFESMQLVSKKKNEEEVFIKLGSDKDKRKEAAEKEEKTKKALSINEFLKPAEGEGFYRSGGRGRGRGRGGRGGFGGGHVNNISAPAIEDTKQFPILGGK